MTGSGCHIGVAPATKDAEMVIGRWRAVQRHVRHGHVQCLGREEVEEVRGGGQGLDPVVGRQTGLEQERAKDIVGGTNNPLGSTVLRQSVGA